MRLGVLDIGSVTAQLQIVDLTAGAPPLPVYAFKTPTFLSDWITPEGAIGLTGIQRVSAAASDAYQIARQQQVDQLYPFVTSAVRDAVNRDQVLDRVEVVAGLRPQFLSGEQEARLTYLAARRWYGWSVGRLLLLDIGGGSMEVAFGHGAAPEFAVSLPLGAGRLTRQFLTSDPPRKKQVKAARRHVRDTLEEVAARLQWEACPHRVVATSKTFKQLARLNGAPPQRKGLFARRTVTLDGLRHWVPRLAETPVKKRAKLRGVSPSRSRQIFAGALIAETTMSVLDVESADVCPWALREGIMLRHLDDLTADADLPFHPLRRADDGAECDATVTMLPATEPADDPA